MDTIHPHIIKLIKAIDLEEKEEIKRFNLDKSENIKTLKQNGLVLYPIQIINQTYGYADYPEIKFKLNFLMETHHFKDGAAIELFYKDEEKIKGILLTLEGKMGELRLYAPDYPDWLNENQVGIKLSPDFRTNQMMKKALTELPKNPILYSLFQQIHDKKINPNNSIQNKIKNLTFFNKNLNSSQQNAVNSILENQTIHIIHGPPGTGKTFTLIEAIRQLVKKDEKILVSTPSNAAIDHLAKGLIQLGVNILRVGNITKIHEEILPYTIEGKLNDPKIKKEIKELKIRSEQFRKMALKYKRNFGKAEREQRNLLFKEVKQIRTELKKLIHYHEEKILEQTPIILGTPIALLDSLPNHTQYDTLIIDEAGQCLEPLAWAIFSKAKKQILAGDIHQLPPTVLSKEANQFGLNQSILEICNQQIPNQSFLDTQYRMKSTIVEFSNIFFYQNKIKTPDSLQSQKNTITFIDTAGTGFYEEPGTQGNSLVNTGELQIIQKILTQLKTNPQDIALISPYSAQITLAKETLNLPIRVSSIDSFQGQEQKNIIISLVRSNETRQIGFLNDYRRMNVALTRAKEKVIIIGDSSTLTNDTFYLQLINYIEKNGEYKSAWEFME